MKRPQEITSWDFPDTISVPDGYDLKSVPDMTRRNFELLIEKHNELVAAFDALYDKVGHSLFDA